MSINENAFQKMTVSASGVIALSLGLYVFSAVLITYGFSSGFGRAFIQSFSLIEILLFPVPESGVIIIYMGAIFFALSNNTNFFSSKYRKNFQYSMPVLVSFIIPLSTSFHLSKLTYDFYYYEISIFICYNILYSLCYFLVRKLYVATCVALIVLLYGIIAVSIGRISLDAALYSKHVKTVDIHMAESICRGCKFISINSSFFAYIRGKTLIIRKIEELKFVERRGD